MRRCALLLFALALAACERADAGAPVMCSGYENKSCDNGRVTKHCCPAGAKCNFIAPDFLECGNGYCTVGRDRGRCPTPTPQAMADKQDEAACKAGWGQWQSACVDHRVTTACIASYPTNYTGPSHNPPFQTCMKNRCTTSQFAEACYPTRQELTRDVECHGKWQKVCLGGKAEERCLPASATVSEFPATQFSACRDGSCVVGADPKLCP